MNRTARVTRQTGETSIQLALDLDGQGRSTVATGVGFLDHMLTLFARHAAVDLTVEATGDLHVDAHHTVEDVGIALGRALKDAVGEKRGIRRYGHITLPMDEALVTAAVDFSGRPYLVFGLTLPAERLGTFETELVEDFFQGLVQQAGINLHLHLHAGRNTHHVIEAAFKATARAVRMAVEPDGRLTDVPSTKGTLTD